MKTILLWGIVLIVSVILYLSVRRIRRNKALLVMQTASQKVVNQALKASLVKVITTEFKGSYYPNAIETELISDVWGKGVMAFEYELPLQVTTINDLKAIKLELTNHLNDYAQQQQLQGYQGHDIFVVSDIWILKGILHLDISYVVNQATLSYLNDINKLEID
ncbi:hypothetical protein [Ligilactobacillus ceti]|uniref:Uncharacterized protein n=1 Tax=Ligilactobacillus ceti DSM 22408 TaxID=1122146 RepID=A0A0R2KNB0_9LACO|nr:hypothetical protein [Ligilactobacillus ceti]KRN88933.1 hypothetical protein IV53_GL000903 [Ligilactobacillus ceti DSM 22408]